MLRFKSVLKRRPPRMLYSSRVLNFLLNLPVCTTLFLSLSLTRVLSNNTRVLTSSGVLRLKKEHR